MPVPPPLPAVTNTMSAPLRISRISSLLSSAAARPTSGFAPAPSPRVILPPMCSLTSASHMSSACASVLTAMNSTPLRPASTIRLTALVPPPPTPTTFDHCEIAGSRVAHSPRTSKIIKSQDSNLSLGAKPSISTRQYVYSTVRAGVALSFKRPRYHFHLALTATRSAALASTYSRVFPSLKYFWMRSGRDHHLLLQVGGHRPVAVRCPPADARPRRRRPTPLCGRPAGRLAATSGVCSISATGKAASTVCGIVSPARAGNWLAETMRGKGEDACGPTFSSSRPSSATSQPFPSAVRTQATGSYSSSWISRLFGNCR